MLNNSGSVPGDTRLRLLELIKRGDRHGAASLLALLEATANGVGDVSSTTVNLDRRFQLKAALEAQDGVGDGTALIWAASCSFDGLVERLLVAGASINARATNNGMTALHAAAERGRTSLVRRLIDRKADVNVRTHLGDTPCHLAAYRGHSDTVQVLLDSSTNYKLRNWRRNDVMGEAIASNSSRTVAVVVSHIQRFSSCSAPDDMSNNRHGLASASSHSLHFSENIDSADATYGDLSFRSVVQ